MTKDEMIKILNDKSNVRGDKIIAFLDAYNLQGLQDATEAQLTEYLKSEAGNLGIYAHEQARKLIIAVDFDGTIVEDKYPEIGPIRPAVAFRLNALKRQGHTIILWTCRAGEFLKHAVKFCKEHNVPVDFVNENPPWRTAQYGGIDCRKLSADYYIDDKNLSVSDFETNGLHR